MAEPQILVLMVQKTRLQGLIWQTVLKSQQISVIWETPDIDLMDSITQLEAAGLALPSLLLLDVQMENFNPYAFCRWCRETHPEIKVVLTNASQKAILPSERQWSLHQGAADFLPGFQRENLVSSVAFSVKRVLDILDSHPLDNGALISVLLAMKRQLDAHDGKHISVNSTRQPTAPSSPADQETKQVPQVPEAIASGSNDMSHSREKPVARSPRKLKFPENGSLLDEEAPPVRRYRGLNY